MILLSLTGVFRTLLIIFGVIFLLQIIGKTAQARRNVAEQQKMKQEERRSQQQTEEAKRNFGRTTISKIDKNKINDNDYTDYEEVE